MDYEQKYNKLVEAVKVLQETNPSDEGIQNWVNDNVPELRESEDERIRKYLIYCVNRTIPESADFNEISKEQILAWLEKQGTSYTKRNVDDAYVEGMAFAKDELEKQGKQILANSEKTCKDEKKHALDIEIPFGAKDSELQEATYLIPEGFHAEIKDNEVLIKKGKQKPANWSEEDERMYNIVFEEYKNRQYYSHPTLEDYDISGQILGWFKSLKDRVIPQQKSTWSEEDEVRLQACIDTLQAKSIMGKVDTIQTNWLKSIKQRIGG